MKFKGVATISSILIFINALLFLILPSFSMSLLGSTLTPAGIMNTRISGACALGLSMILWQSRDIPRSTIQLAISKSLLVTFIILLAIDIHGIITGAINNIGWIIFIADSLLAIAFIFTICTGTVVRK